MDKNTIFRFVIILVALFVLIPNLIECRGGRGGSSGSRGGGGSRSSSYSSRSYSGSSYYSYSRTYSPVLLYSYSYYGYDTGYVTVDRSESLNVAGFLIPALFVFIIINIMVLKIIVVQTGRTCKQACCCVYCCDCEKPEIDETELKNDCTDPDAS